MKLLRVWVILFAALSAFGQEPLGRDYSNLRPGQKRLIDDLVARLGRAIGQKLDPEKVYNEAPESQRTTFDAVTHALLKTQLTDSDGKKLGTALDLVDAIEEVAGELRGEPGDRQFRVYVFLKPDAMPTLEKSREFKRGPENTVYHRGYPICFRLDRTPSIQFSLSADQKRGDVDVDYRSSKFPAGLVNGHLTASNSDVRAGKNEVKHNGRWDGLVAWWSSLFAADGAASNDVTIRARRFPASPPKGKGKIEEAVDDFFQQWVVQGNAPNAVSYFSRDSYPCVAQAAELRKERVERGMVKVYLANRFAAFHKQGGLKPKLSDALSPVPAWSAEIKPVPKQPSPDAYLLSSLPASYVEAWDCDGDTSANLGRGEAYLSSVRYAAPGGNQQDVGFVWQKDGDAWRIVSATLLNADARAKTMGAGAVKSASAKTVEVDGDPDLVRAATAFAESWFLKKAAGQALDALLPEAYGCLDANSEKKPPASIPRRKDQMARGMNQYVQSLTSAPAKLSDAIQAPPPGQDGLRVVKHANAKSLLIVQLSDQAAALMQCGERATSKAIQAKLGTERTFGDHYMSIFQLNTSGTPGVFAMAWKRDAGRWRVYFWQVETP